MSKTGGVRGMVIKIDTNVLFLKKWVDAAILGINSLVRVCLN